MVQEFMYREGRAQQQLRKRMGGGYSTSLAPSQVGSRVQQLRFR